MYITHHVPLDNSRSIKYKLYQNDSQLRYTDFLDGLENEKRFRSFFINLLCEVPFDAYHWETPSVRSSTKDRSFEFVVSNAPGIDLPPNYGPFEQYFESMDKTVVVFDNLDNDAKLIAPAPLKKNLNYSHIGVFTRQAPDKQQHALWQRVGQITQELISDQPLWLNTAGGGVAWLHVRLDGRPKYYMHGPYRTTEAGN